MAIKTQRLYYISRNLTSGLSDVTADIYKDGNATPVATAVSLSELDATNSPGVYILELTSATLGGYGGTGVYLARINSASKPAVALAKFEVLANNEDELEVHLTAIENKIDDLTSDVADVQTDVTAIKAKVDDSNAVLRDANIGNANLKALSDQIIAAISTIQNNTRFIAVVPPQMTVPDTTGATNTYRIDIRLFDMEGHPENPDNAEIDVILENIAGVDRNSYLAGYTAGDTEVTISPDSVGVFHIDVIIPDTAALEQLRFKFNFSENSIAQSIPRTTELVVEAQASGLALQSTLLDVLTDTADIQPRTLNIENIISDSTYGLAALKALIDIIDGVVDANNSELTDSVTGLAALKSILDSKSSQTSVNAIMTAITNDVKGSGFDITKDTLHQISDRTYFGGTAI